MTPDATLAVQSAVLPFARVWKTLDPALQVVSLESPQESWRQLLAGQGIGLSEDTVPPSQEAAVLTGFGMLDTHDADTLESWAAETLPMLRPGGLLVLGGANPEHPQSGHRGLFPAAAVRALRQAGFARVRVIRPGPPAGDTSLSSAFHGGSETYAVVAQTEAFGKAFDVFSPVFLDASATSPQDNLRRAEDALQGRIHHATSLNARITEIETALRARLEHSENSLRDSFQAAEKALQDRLQRAEDTLQDQRDEIAGLHETIDRLKSLTRRRGLRKLVHRIKLKWRGHREEPVPLREAPAVKRAPPPAPSETALPAAVTPVATSPAPSADPVPLSPREAALAARLFGPGGQ